MTQDDFLRGLRWWSQPWKGEWRMACGHDPLLPGRKPLRVFYTVDPELFGTIRNKELWLADRVAFMQEVMLAKAGFLVDG